MKTIMMALAVSLAAFTACNSNNNNGNPEVQNGQQGLDTNRTAATETHLAMPMVHSYLKIKNALAADDAGTAAEAGKAMAAVINDVDASGFTPEQKKIYDEVWEDMHEHAEHIGDNAGNIAHQREHFEILSKDVYDLVKVTGAGQTLYYTHCPMYNKNKGAYWLSAEKEIKNPYLGKMMMDCGTVKEELQ